MSGVSRARGRPAPDRCAAPILSVSALEIRASGDPIRRCQRKARTTVTLGAVRFSMCLEHARQWRDARRQLEAQG